MRGEGHTGGRAGDEGEAGPASSGGASERIAGGRGTGPALIEESITAADLGRIPSSSDEPISEGAQAAREALGSAPEIEAPIESEGVVELAEMALGLVVFLFASSTATEDQIAKAGKLAAAERGALRIFAEGAAPYVGSASRASPELAGYAFLGLLAVFGWKHVKAVRAKPEEEKREPIGKPTSKGKLDAKEWGSAADIAGMVHEPVDSGRLPPRFKPEPIAPK